MQLHALKSWETHPWLRWWPLLSWLALFLTMVGTAWVCDDAYITFRTVDNLLHGHGAVFNVGERVQSFTHPLWMLLHVPFYALTGNIYYVTLFLSFTLSLGAAALLARLLRSRMAWGLVPLVLLCSKAYVEYATSGLENPLTVFLLVLFAYVLLEREGHARQLLHLSLVLALVFTNRMDAILMLFPALAWRFWQVRSWRNVGLVLLGFLPIFAWELFSVIYYGFPFPNTAYAKLGTGIPQGQLLRQGVYYFLDSISRDMLTVPLILLGALCGLFHKRAWPLAIGVSLYLVYILRIGGDFMTGRFMMAPFALSVTVLLYTLRDGDLVRKYLLPAAFVFSHVTAMVLMLQFFDPRLSEPLINANGIANERSFYNAGTGLLHAFKGHRLPAHSWVENGQRIAASPDKVHVVYTLGFNGFYAGPGRFLIDRYALSDPLLARLPCIYSPRRRPGHYERILPAGFEESLRTDSNVLADPELRTLYGDLRLITRGPIWSSERWAAIWRQNTASKQDFARYAAPVTQRHTVGSGDSTVYQLSPITGLRLLPGPAQAAQVTLDYQSLCDVALTQHFQGGKVRSIWLSAEYPDSLPTIKTIDWPANLDSISIYPIGECGGGVKIWE